MDNNRILTIVVRKLDGTFSEKFSVAINSDVPRDMQDVKNFVNNFMMHGKAKWFEIYEGTNIYFGDSRAKPIFSTRDS